MTDVEQVASEARQTILSTERIPRWLRAEPTRITTTTAVALLVGGTCTVAYRVIRAPAHFGFGWFAAVPWY